MPVLVVIFHVTLVYSLRVGSTTYSTLEDAVQFGTPGEPIIISEFERIPLPLQSLNFTGDLLGEGLGGSFIDCDRGAAGVIWTFTPISALVQGYSPQ